MVRPRKEYTLVEKSAKLLGKTNGALNTKMAMRAAVMTDDDANNRSLKKLVHLRCKELNVVNFPLSFNDLSAKDPPSMSPLTLPSTDVSFITFHTTSYRSGIKCKHPPLTRQIRESSSQMQQVYAKKIGKKRLIRELLRKLQ